MPPEYDLFIVLNNQNEISVLLGKKTCVLCVVNSRPSYYWWIISWCYWWTDHNDEENIVWLTSKIKFSFSNISLLLSSLIISFNFCKDITRFVFPWIRDLILIFLIVENEPFSFNFVWTKLILLITWISCRYAQYGDISPKVDVYAFGVVLYELISAKNAVLKTGESVAESKGLVALVSLHTPSMNQFTNKTLSIHRKEVKVDLFCISVWRST